MTLRYNKFFLTTLLIATASLLTIDVAYGQQSPTTAGRRGPALDQGAGTNLGNQGATGLERPDGRRPTGARSTRESGTQVMVIEGQASRVAPRISVGIQGGFAPIHERELQYDSVPEMDESVRISLAGPMLAVDFLDALALATG